MKLDIKSCVPDEIAGLMKQWGQPRFRADQVFSWMHSGCESFGDMTNLPAALRRKLEEECCLTCPSILRKQVSEKDGTVKYLWKLGDGNSVESVVMKYRYGYTICISTQVGCRMGCMFCASTLGGLVRCLEPSEMLDQVLFAQKDMGIRISNNFDSVLRFLQLVNSPQGLQIGMRHISLSTCGLVEKVDKLAEYNLQLTLSVSLHAPDDETRSRIMPVNRRYGVDEVLAACSRYFEKTGRRISYEYAMIRDVNDTDRHAKLLAEKLKGTGAHVNLIRLNHVEERGLTPSTPQQIERFTRILQDGGVAVTLRRRLGSDIDASCGQLRRKTENN